jgi:ferric-dicitrate binding protein FerR (iron transport regulator)
MKRTQMIYRILAGEASEEEKIIIEEWKGLSEANRIEYDDVKTLWECSRDTGGSDFSEEGYRKGWEQIKQRMHVYRQRRKRMRMIIVIVILVFLLGVLGWFAYYKGRQEKPSLHGYHAEGSCIAERCS